MRVVFSTAESGFPLCLTLMTEGGSDYMELLMALSLTCVDVEEAFASEPDDGNEILL